MLFKHRLRSTLEVATYLLFICPHPRLLSEREVQLSDTDSPHEQLFLSTPFLLQNVVVLVKIMGYFL
jgi:hypothetical protein